MTKFKAGDSVRVRDTNEIYFIAIVDSEPGVEYKYALNMQNSPWYSDDELELVQAPEKVYVVAIDEGHGEWSLSDDIKEEDLLEYLSRGYGSNYRVFTEVKVSLSIEDK